MSTANHDPSTSAPPHVFISHGKADTWLAGRIAESVRQRGASTFLDETDIATGDNFKVRIQDEIRKCQELIALFTPWSAKRFWVWVEVGAAWGQSKRVVAVLYGISVTELEAHGGSRAMLEDINVVELNTFDKYLSQLGERVRELSGG